MYHLLSPRQTFKAINWLFDKNDTSKLVDHCFFKSSNNCYLTKSALPSVEGSVVVGSFISVVTSVAVSSLLTAVAVDIVELSNCSDGLDGGLNIKMSIVVLGGAGVVVVVVVVVVDCAVVVLAGVVVVSLVVLLVVVWVVGGVLEVVVVASVVVDVVLEVVDDSVCDVFVVGIVVGIVVISSVVVIMSIVVVSSLGAAVVFDG